jgi:hypothetical protein
MLWRHIRLARAWPAVILVRGVMLLAASLATAQTTQPADPEKASPPVEVVTETVDLLEASRGGELRVVARGQGEDRVRLTIKNTGRKRLNVTLPPGLVAAAATGQGGRGLQSMGLGMFSNRPGAFGQFRDTGSPRGFRSVPVEDPSARPRVTIPASETMHLTIPAVCLNYGLPTPTPRDTFTLMEVEQYSADARVRKSLRSLTSLGTSRGVAQAVMWRVCNDVPFETMTSLSAKAVNEHEIALACRFVEALEASTGSDLVDPALLNKGRVFVRVQGEGALARDAKRLNGQLESGRILGLPVRVIESGEVPSASAPALFVKVVLTDARTGEARGRVIVSYCPFPDQWRPLGKATFQDSSSLAVLDGQALSQALDRAIAAAFVTVKPARRTVGSTTLKVENHLPFTLAALTLKAGTSAGAPTVPFQAVGVGPARSTRLSIQAASATIERVELNGL